MRQQNFKEKNKPRRRNQDRWWARRGRV